MLQPFQLQAVSMRYAKEIAEMRAFLEQYGIAVGTPEATGDVVARLRGDRSFHRDLMSNVWILLDGSGLQISYADLLGVMAIAAAGMVGAAATDEDVAHGLLGFLLESRHALDRAMPHANAAEQAVRMSSISATRPMPQSLAQQIPDHAIPVSTATLASSTSVSAREPEIATRQAAAVPASPHLPTTPRREPPTAPSGGHSLDPEPPLRPRAPATRSSERWAPPIREEGGAGNRSSRRLVYVVGGACAMALLVGAYTLLRHPTVETVRTPRAPIVSGAAASPVSVSRPSAMAPETAPEIAPGTATSRPDRGGASPSAFSAPTTIVPERQPRAPSRSANDVPQPVSTSAVAAGYGSGLIPVPASRPAFSSNAPAVPVIANTARPSASSAAPPVAIRSAKAGSAVPVAVPAATLSKQLDSPKIAYAYEPSELDSSGRRVPRLHRRNNTGQIVDDPNLLAEMHAPDIPGAASVRNGSPGVASGIVRTTCLGMMAGNLMSSPSPAYPAAAAAARVQGEVRIQATVERDGSVGSARVVSGPPLLRDAALNAVQQWRYKPFQSGGKAVPAGTVAVIEFQLP